MSSGWTLSFEVSAFKELKKLDPKIAERILSYLEERVLTAESPRDLGKQLKGKLSQLWRYRLGDYRILCELRDSEFVVLVVRVAHRSNVY